MSCKDVDNLRLSSDPAAEWPEEAKLHLRSCARCSRLQALMDDAPAPQLPEALRSKLELAILSNLKPATPILPVFTVTTILLLAGLLVVALGNWYLGVKGWHARSTQQITLTFALLGLSIWLLARLLAVRMMPGSRVAGPILSYIAVPAFTLSGLTALLYGDVWDPNALSLALNCWRIGVTCAAFAALLFSWILRRGYRMNPASQGAATGFLSGLVGLTVLEIFCPYLDRLHISASHIGTAATSAILGALIGFLAGGNRSRALKHSDQ